MVGQSGSGRPVWRRVLLVAVVGTLLASLAAPGAAAVAPPPGNDGTNGQPVVGPRPTAGKPPAVGGARAVPAEVDLARIYTPAAAWTLNRTRLDVFQVQDGYLWQRYWVDGNGWSLWVRFDPPSAGFGSQPSVTWTGDGHRIDVFVTDTLGHLMQKYWTAGVGWTGWVDLGGTLISAPSASWVADGSRIDVFGFGTDYRLYQKYWRTGAGWTNWIGFSIPASVTALSSPSVAWVADGGRIDVFFTASANASSDAHLFQLYWVDTSGWHGWYDLGGGLDFEPPAATWASDIFRIDVFGIGGSYDRVYQRYWPGAWNGWIDLGDGPSQGIVDGPAATWTRDGNRVDVIVTGANGHAYQKYWVSGSPWSGWVDLG
jgi:hypothetical protein